MRARAASARQKHSLSFARLRRKDCKYLMEALILSAHLIVILFMVIGFPVGLVVNNRKFRLFHAGTLIFITSLMVIKIPCPLTVLEEFYAGKSYDGSFISYWLNKIVYIRWLAPQLVLVIDICFALLVFSSFYWRPLKYPVAADKNNKSKHR